MILCHPSIIPQFARCTLAATCNGTGLGVEKLVNQQARSPKRGSSTFTADVDLVQKQLSVLILLVYQKPLQKNHCDTISAMQIILLAD